jgi:hypothetical protein
MKNEFAGLVREQKKDIVKKTVAFTEEPQEKPTPVIKSKKDTKLLGKNKRDDYKLVSFYLKKDTHLAFKRAMLGQDRDMSDIVETLVSNWVKKS